MIVLAVAKIASYALIGAGLGLVVAGGSVWGVVIGAIVGADIAVGNA